MEASIRRETETPLHDFAADPLREDVSEAGPTGSSGELRARMQAALEKARAVCQRLQEQTVNTAKATDRTIREHPYQAMGIAFGVGAVIGYLLMRRRNR